MRRRVPLLAMLLAGACSVPQIGSAPTLAPRAAEAIDPRVPIPSIVPSGPADPSLANKLAELVGEVRAGVPTFEAREADASRLAAAAGPMASESWVAAQQALSQLVEQYGVTTLAAANIDALASTQLDSRHWIAPGDQAAITAAAAEVAGISDAQAAAIDRLKQQLAR